MPGVKHIRPLAQLYQEIAIEVGPEDGLALVSECLPSFVLQGGDDRLERRLDDLAPGTIGGEKPLPPLPFLEPSRGVAGTGEADDANERP